MGGGNTSPPRTDGRPGRLQVRYRSVTESVRFRRPASSSMKTCVAVLIVALLSVLPSPSSSSALGTSVSSVEQLKPTVGNDGYNVSQDGPLDATGEIPTDEAAISLEPQALSLTSQLADGPTAVSVISEQNDASLQLLPDSLAPSTAPDNNSDGRRRRRLGRKRKRRPLQDDYWPPAVPPEDNDADANGAPGGRLSERKRFPYAGAAASRWEGINKLPTASSTVPHGGRLARPEQPLHGSQLHHHHHPRANDWMNNPYTDAVNVEQQLHPSPGARRPSAVGGNLPPIDPNRPRRIPSVRASEPTMAATVAPAATGANPKAYRKPYSQARRSEEQFSSPDGSGEAAGSPGGKPTVGPSSATDLKALLKQSDGLSLSEILQQRNISLQDLIRGKQMALAALTQSPLDVSTSADGTDTTTVSPTLSSVRFRVYDDDDGFTGRPGTASGGALGTMTMTTTTTPHATTNELPSSGPAFSAAPAHSRVQEAIGAEDDNNNSVVDDIGTSPDVPLIFPTVEIKQLALNPVLPFLKEERLRPIKGVASRIRPDLSNTHIRTSEPARFPGAGGNGKRLLSPPSGPSSAAPLFTARGSPSSTAYGAPDPITVATGPASGSSTTVGPNPTVPSLLLITSTARERWTPSATLVGQRQRQASLLPATNSKASSKQGSHQATRSSTPPTPTPEPPTAKELVAFRLGSAESTSMLPEAEAMVELAPERPHHLPLLRVPKPKTRIAIKPRLTNVVPPTTATVGAPTSTSAPKETADRFNLSDVELGEGDGPPEGGARPTNGSDGSSQSRRQQRLHDDEPELNIIEKFTSFGEPPGSVSLEGKSAGSSEARSEDQEVADLIGRISEHTQRSFTDSLEEFYRDVTESNPSLFNDLAPIASSDDRRELLELMEDRRIGSRLAKVLSQRNMTLEQLLEHRRRGSSQLHLAEFVNGKAKPIDDKIDIVTAFEHFPRFNIGNLRSIRPDDIKLDSQGFSYFTSIINIRPSDDVYKETRALQARHRGETRRQLPAAVAGAATSNHRNEAHFLAPGGSKDRLLVPSRMSAASATRPYGSHGNYENNDAHGNNDDDDDSNDARENVLEHDLLDMELSGHGFQHHRSASVTIESTSIPVGVRSAIVASSAIVGVSLAIFITIFVACRLRQRRRQKLNYTENFHMAKGRLPIIHGADLEARKGSPSSASASGSGRSSSIGEQVVYTTHRALGGAACGSAGASGSGGATTGRQQSAMMDSNSVDVQDYLWDRKPFQ